MRRKLMVVVTTCLMGAGALVVQASPAQACSEELGSLACTIDTVCRVNGKVPICR